MATAVVARPKVRSDDIFFPGMALLILAIVLMGFGQSYFLAGMVRAKLPNTLVHIHGAVFVTWIFFLVLQTSLVAARKVKLHMTLGVGALILLPLMIVLGVLTVFDFIRRGSDGIPPELLLVGDLAELTLFVAFTTWGLLARRDAAAHKRLMILGTLAIMGPALDRFPIPHTPIETICVQIGLPLLLVAYDLWSRRRVHRVTIIGCALIGGGLLLMFPFSQLAFWQPAIRWILRG
jgi:hypothetical protein